MTEQELAAIEAAAAKATPGPWVEKGETWEGDGTGGAWVDFADDGSDGGAFVSRFIDRGVPTQAQPEDLADAAFIAGARAWVPALVAEVRRLRAEVRQWRAERRDAL